MSLKSFLISRTAKVLLVGAALAGIVALQISQIRGMHSAPNAPEVATAANKEKPAPASGGTVMAEGRLVTYPGAEVTLASEVDGILNKVLVKEKQTVKQGELLVEVSAYEIEAARSQAQSRLAETEVDIKMYTREDARAKQLVEANFISPQMREKNLYDLNAARSRHATAAAEIRRIDAMLAKTRIRAPIDGTVISRKANAGETVTRGGELMTIANLDKLRIEAEVDEFDAKHVNLGDEVQISAEGYDGVKWRGHIEEIPVNVVARRLQPQDTARPTDTRVLLVKIALDEPIPLKLGQRLEAHFKPRKELTSLKMSKND
jgi:HlyD family secretion protein